MQVLECVFGQQIRHRYLMRDAQEHDVGVQFGHRILKLIVAQLLCAKYTKIKDGQNSAFKQAKTKVLPMR